MNKRAESIKISVFGKIAGYNEVMIRRIQKLIIWLIVSLSITRIRYNSK
jgi:hypothetical protein